MSAFPNYIYRFKGIPKLFCGYQQTDSKVYKGKIYKIKFKNMFIWKGKRHILANTTLKKKNNVRD